MKTVDIHTHLLSSEVSFHRPYDRFALRLFGKKFGLDVQALAQNPFNAYIKALTDSVRTSAHVGKVVLFGVDARVDDAGCELHRDATVCASNEDVLGVFQQHGDVVIPFFSINPKRPDALDLIDTYVEQGFRGAKFLQNYWGVDTREVRYRPYFEKLAALGLPLIVHVGSESSVDSVPACERLEMLDQPVALGVNTICAHMALSYSIFRPIRSFSNNPKYFGDEYFRLLKKLEQHDNLYADISALLTPVRARVLRHLSEQQQIHHKLLFGTDFPVPFSMRLNSYDLPWKERVSLSRIANPFDRYTKAVLAYFGEENPVYSNYGKILKEKNDSEGKSHELASL